MVHHVSVCDWSKREKRESKRTDLVNSNIVSAWQEKRERENRLGELHYSKCMV